MCKRHVALLNKLRQRLNNFQRELQAPGLWEELTEPPPAVIEGLPEAVRNMIDEVLKLGRLPKQNKRASNAAEREENQLAKRYSKLKSSLSADIRRALGQLTPAPAASGAGSAAQPAAGDAVGRTPGTFRCPVSCVCVCVCV